MPRETKFRGIILKKQPLGEGDEIVTFFTREQGKVRGLAKSVKSSKSRLQQKLQALFLVDFTLTHGRLPKIISAEPVKVFARLRENLSALKRAFYAQELALKFTADEQKNLRLFDLLSEFLDYLNGGAEELILDFGLAKFKLEILDTAGLGVRLPAAASASDPIYFSLSKGGFSQTKSAEALPVSAKAFALFLELKNSNWKKLKTLRQGDGNQELQNLLSQFIEYQLERAVRSEKFLRQ